MSLTEKSGFSRIAGPPYYYFIFGGSEFAPLGVGTG